jgi:ribonuclease-3
LEIVELIFSESIEKADPQIDYKTRLQEEVQKLFGTLPEYRLMEETGPPHSKRFKVGLFLNDRFITEAEGRSKKEAEKKVAKEALKWLRR